MAAQTTVILGGGVGGIVTARELRRLAPAEHRIVLVERNPLHAFAPSFLWLMVGQRTRDEITRPLRELLPPGVEVVHAAARRIDTANRRLELESETLAFDDLVIATGTELAFDGVPGLNQTHTFFTLSGAESLRDELTRFRGGSVAIVVSSLPYKCPGAPAEGAMLIADQLRSRGVTASVALYTPEPQPMPVAGPELGRAVLQMLNERTISYHPLHKLLAVEGRRLLFEGRDPAGADLIVTIPPHRPAPILREAGLTNEAGWVKVDPRTMQTEATGVYAIGDCAAVPLPGRWQPDVPLMLPKAGVFAHAQGLVVARRIAARLRGGRDDARFCGEGFCTLEAGERLAGFAWGDFFATPSPKLHLRRVGPLWHSGKVMFERWWLSPSGVRRRLMAFGLKTGGRILGIPVEL